MKTAPKCLDKNEQIVYKMYKTMVTSSNLWPFLRGLRFEARLAKGVRMGKKISMLNDMDNVLVSQFADKSIKHKIDTKIEFTINVAGTDFNNIEEAIIHAYRCGLAAMNSEQTKIHNENVGSVDQDELYRILKKSHSLEHKADFLREIAKEWFPLELHNEKKIKTVNLELNELADFLSKD